MESALSELGKPDAPAGSLSGPAIPPSPGGLLGSGTAGIEVGGQQGFSPVSGGVPQTGGGLVQAALQLGIPRQAIASDLAFNQGKGISDMLYKRGAPNIEAVNGVFIDKNRVQPGFSIPSVSQNGQASQTIMDPSAPGGFRIIAPQGAVETFAGYKNAEKEAENRNTLLPPTYVDQGTRRPIGGTVGDYITQQRAAQPLQNMGGAPLSAALEAAIKADAQRNGISNPQVNLSAAEPGMPSTAGMRNPTLALQSQVGGMGPRPGMPGQLPPSVVRVSQATPGTGAASGQLQSAAEAAGENTAATKAAESAQAYKDALDGKVEEEFQLVNRNKQITPLLAKFTTGGMLPEERLHFGNAISNSGVLPDGLKKTLGDWIAGGDTTAGKVIENQLASAGILNMLQTLDKEGKPNRAIFQAVQKAQEGLNSGNTTLKDVFELQKRLYDIHYNEQQALTDAIKSGSYNPRTWAGDYARVRNEGLNAPAEPLPSTAPPVATTKGRAPVAIKSDAEFSMLPSGALFIGPDGKTRRKP